MTIGGGFRRMTRLLRRLERNGWTIESVELPELTRLSTRTQFSARIECYFWEPSPDVDPQQSLLEICERHDSVDISPVIHVDDELEQVSVVLDCTITISREQGDDGPTVNQRELPPLHRDVERLERLYEQFETFDEMAEAIDMEVSAETIRRYTIEHGIHEPARMRRWSDQEDENTERFYSVPVDNSVQLHGRDIETVVEAVETGNTLFDVQRALDLSRARTITLLRSLNLLDLVVGRLEEVEDREVRRETIRNRLRSADAGDTITAAVGRNW